METSKYSRLALALYFIISSILSTPIAWATDLEHKSEICSYALEFATTETPEDVTALSLFPEDPRELGIDEAKDLEDQALRAMENALPKNGGEEKQAVRDWFKVIQSHQEGGRHLSVMEHSTLTFILREGLFDEDPDPTILSEIRSALHQSWFHFIGTEVSEKDLTERLPKRVLMSANHDEQLFHQAIFHEGKLGFLGSMRTLAKDYIPRPQDAIYALVLGSALFSRTGSEILAGFLEGYAINTFVEYFFHRYLGHASPRTLKILDKTGWLGRQVRAIAFAHGIHHSSYGENYVEQFAPRDLSRPDAEDLRSSKKSRVDALIESKGEDRAKAIFDSDYGNRLESPLSDIAMTIPFTVALSLFSNFITTHLGLHPSVPFYSSLAAASALYVPASYYLHQYLHKTSGKAFNRAGPMMRWFLTTRYVAWDNRTHFVHHQESGVPNQNLAVGADFIFGYQPLTVEHLFKIKSFDPIY